MKGSRRDREKARQRQEMLEAALSLFSEKGYHNVSMHEIAGKAEFAIGTLYKFFKNKEDLYKAMMLEKAEEFHSSVREAMDEHQDDVERLRDYVRTVGKIFHNHIPVIRLYFSETHGASFNMMAGLDSELKEGHERFLQILTSVFADGIQKKRFKRIADPYYLAVSLDGIISAFLIRWLDTPERHPFPEDPDIILNILFKSLVDE